MVPVGAMLPETGETLAVKVTTDPALAWGGVGDTVSAVVVLVGVWKVALTDPAAVMEREHVVTVPVQAPLQPEKLAPAAGFAVNRTAVPLAKFALQVPGQLMPPEELVTEPEPDTVTDRRNVTAAVKVAVTDRAALMLTVHVPVPEQAPLHPAKVEPAAAVAVKVTVVPLAKLALQVLRQAMPAGVLATEPEPLPAKVTVRGKVAILKVAVTDCAAVMFTLQVPVPEQAPLQPAKVPPAAAVGVKVTVVPLAKFALQAPGQLIPAGLLVTVPFALPATVTFRGRVLGLVLQLGNVKLAMRVFQLNVPVVFMYSVVNQKVQSSTGSTCMAL